MQNLTKNKLNMKQEQIKELFEKFESACVKNDEIEFWKARNLMNHLGYNQWKNFHNVIEKAKKACQNAGENISDHFIEVKLILDLGNNAKREVDDVALTRYACYLIAQNGDPSKSEIAFAQTYFAVQTRKQEIIEQRLLDIARLTAREKLSKSEKKLSGIIYERGVDDKGFSIIRSKGDQALFGGWNTSEMKSKLNVPGARPLADFLPTLIVKAKDFATELTSHNVVDKDIHGQQKISEEHVENNRAVRKMLGERGVTPERLPPAEDIQKVKRKLESDEKKVLKDVKKIKGNKK